jgi:N-acetylglucosaminyldiphosphoundecaprenol N-acetyl-beta-D-mannosaminyltransferase
MATPVADVFGVPFFAGKFREAADVTIERALSGDGGYACLTSAHGLMLARHHVEVRRALLGAWMNFPDGVPITWVQHSDGYGGAERVCGIDLMPLVLEIGQARGLRHFLLGSTESVLRRLQERIAVRWPAAQVVGTHSPPFGAIGDHEVLGIPEQIRRTSPHIVWVGLGAPKQDLWGEMYSRSVAPALVLGVGAAFDFVSESQRRAPRWMQHHGLEWLFRVGIEPRRLAGRYTRANSEFFGLLVRHRATKALTRSRA